MQSAAGAVVHRTRDEQPPTPPSWVIQASIITNILVAIICIVVAWNIVQVPIEEFGNLGRPVQVAISFFVLIPAAIALFGSIQLFRKQSAGRYATLLTQGISIIVAIIMLIQIWGVFLSFEALVDGVMGTPLILIGFPIAYGLYWFSGKLDENSQLRETLDKIALGLGMLTLMAVLWFSNILGGIGVILSSYGNLITWFATIALVVFGYLGWQLLHLGEQFAERPEDRQAWQGWLMLSPNIIGFIIFFAGPLLLSLWLSFTDSSVGQTPNFIFLDNYGEILSLEFQWQDDLTLNAQDALSFGYNELGSIYMGEARLVIGARDTLFWISLRNTIVFCLMLVPLSTIPALFLSMILNSKLPGVKFFRAVYFLPSVAAVVGTALIWRWLYDPTIGFYNYIISSIVAFLNTSFGFSLTDPNIQWLTGPGVVLVSIVFLAAWQVVGFNTVLFLAGLQGIPNVLYEAATVDGANRWKQFTNVTLPMLMPTTFFVIITTVITGLQVFNEPYALFPSRPIPVNATTSVFYLYNRGFFRFEFGYASAIAWLLFGLIFLITLAQFRLSRSEAYDN